MYLHLHSDQFHWCMVRVNDELASDAVEGAAKSAAKEQGEEISVVVPSLGAALPRLELAILQRALVLRVLLMAKEGAKLLLVWVRVQFLVGVRVQLSQELVILVHGTGLDWGGMVREKGDKAEI